MRALVFADRCVKELLRDPLSWIFCLLFPLAMLAIFTWLAGSIPAEAGMEIFQIDRLCAGIAVFSFTFVMLFCRTARLQRSQQRISHTFVYLTHACVRFFDRVFCPIFCNHSCANRDYIRRISPDCRMERQNTFAPRFSSFSGDAVSGGNFVYPMGNFARHTFE